jgi:hypothetical protein
MPNHVTNRVEITSDNPEKIDALIESLKTSDEQIFDFNSVIKMPEDSDTFQATGSVSMLGGCQSPRGNWYDWSRENWGTKWNAYSATMERNSKNQVTYTFQTAWACPFPVIQKLAEKFQVYVRCAYYDEDFGNNCGIYDVDEFGLTGEKKDYSENGLEFIAEEFGEEVLIDNFYVRDDSGCWVCKEI